MFIKDSKPEIVTLSNELSFVDAVIRFTNAKFFDGATPKIVITFDEMPNAYGCVSAEKILTDEKTKGYYYMMKLNHITARTAGKTDLAGLRITSTIIHEMIHIHNAERKIKDVSNGNRYHNGKFKSECDRIGLPNFQDPTIGTRTDGTLTPALSAMLAEFFKDENPEYASLFTVKSRLTLPNFPTAPQGDDGEDGEDGEDTPLPIEKPKAHNLTVYICPKCGMKARAKVGANLICGDCNEKMMPKEDAKK